ncbi:transcriptional regulator [Alkalihalobacillus alcalophilus ATCC 27647 = CGMCC 1.3604]|uniref:Transcriptional regulator n=1 Tax=Alkalihalobacillus alcalophilus ATCC 27647 = CGMCC 1.3604 TaxID=1218173 RepID=A0A094XA80_ALKAL|nr:helix-turn-helix transcriptional regulator [Alkalihalobacillus alcalophilus]KGA95680.1 transcriptional regulator [Alkalihalobacillus alcalophilus ATCC 27647 = CGMCC 1.3604]MED1563230.1 helix-turn-helix transcriptional regulator [Alkalihalobacillus alcalophilus]THG91462.1 transcriptional regulator [Alkalihalobacillus alcalophilus ATCC 27647 = CGMCC 1.3604]
MLTNNLQLIMAQKKIKTVTHLSEITGISRGILSKLWHEEQIETMKLETLIRICDSLDIKLSELVEYEPVEQVNGDS